MKSPGIQLKYPNEIPRHTFEKSHWNSQAYHWNIPMKSPGIHLKYPNEILRHTIEKSQWNNNEIAIEMPFTKMLLL
jgi:hypothetical protein